MKTEETEICIVGSGAGAGPIAYSLSEAGFKVAVLEKGPWFTEKDFYKDEIAVSRRSTFTPKLSEEKHVLEQENNDGTWEAESTEDSGWDFWNGNCVGGSSNFMTGFFHRLKPFDFRLRSEFGEIKNANVADWPIAYEDMEPYYALVEKLVGVSGRVVQHPFLEPRSTKDFPYPPTLEHPIAKKIDENCKELGLFPIPAPRAVLPYAAMNRGGCSYSGFCGSYGCATGAKGSSRAALLNAAIRTGKCEVKPNSMVAKLISDKKGNVVAAQFYNEQNELRQIRAKIFVVACQAIETSRLLLLSTGEKHPAGLGNNQGQLGKNLLFSAGGAGGGDFLYEKLSDKEVADLKIKGPFINRALQDWYVIKDKNFGDKAKGGLVEFDFQHPNLINRADKLKWEDGKLLWGNALKKKLKAYFTGARHLRYEVFCDWSPNDNCFVSLDSNIKDKWGLPAAKVRLGSHPYDLKVGEYIAEKVENVFAKMGASNISSSITPEPPSNLMAGGCRFGRDPKTSVLDPDCRVHNVANLFVTDGSFMPTGGSVPYTFTIYANSFRVADKIRKQLGKEPLSVS